MAKRTQKQAGQRPLRVGEEVRHALAQIIERGELRDPDLAGVSVTITEVAMSPDLRNATAFVAPLGGGDSARTVAALERAVPFLRRRIGDAVRLRYVPKLRIAADTSFDYAERIERRLSEVAAQEREDED